MALSASIGSATAANNLFTSSSAQAGYTAVQNSLKRINLNGQVDISRSSSSDPKTTKLNGSGSTVTTDSAATIAGIPFARDAIALAFSPELVTALRTAEGLSATDTPYLTVAQLTSIFSCTGTSLPVVTVGTTAITFNPVIPQSGSGTRKDFLSKLGITDNTTFVGNTGVGKCIGLGQEHDATTAEFAGVSGALITNAVMPMSASRWIAMKNGASFDRSGTAVIGSVATTTTASVASLASIVSGTVVASPVVSAAQLSPNKAYYDDTTWGRDVYLFVERARITVGDPKFDQNLYDLLDPTLNTLSNISTAGASKVGKVKLAYGFLAPSSTTVNYYGPKYSG
jgi:hypothetical protein